MKKKLALSAASLLFTLLLAEAARFPQDGHWNAAGHEALGKVFAPRVRALAGG